MKLKSLFIIFMIGLCAISLSAQDKKPHFDVEAFKKGRADFFIKELGLTDAEQTKFIPLVDELMFKKFQINKEVRDASRELKDKKTKTEADYQKVLDLSSEAKIKEAQVLKEYYKKFGEVLPAEKVYKFHRVEMKFMQQAVKHHHGPREGKESRK